MLTERLKKSDRIAMQTHLLSLSREERQMRFGFVARDSSIERYVNDIDFERDAVFGFRQSTDSTHAFDGVVHLALAWNHAEIGVSVLAPARGLGIGSALVSRAALHARNCGIATLFMQNLAQNCGVIRIAASLGIKVITTAPENTPLLPIQPMSNESLTRAEDIEHISLYDAALLKAVVPPLAQGWLARSMSDGTLGGELRKAI